jgi:hypothetical protein
MVDACWLRYLVLNNGQVTPTYKEIAVSAKIKRKKDGDFGKKEGECV